MMNKLEKYKILIFIIIVLTTGFLVLTQTTHLKIMEDKAKENVYLSLKQSITSQIYNNYPLLDNKFKEQKVEEEFNKIKNSESIKKQIKDISKKYKDYYRDPNGQIYLYSVDPYIFLIGSKNLLEYGTLGDQGKTSKLRRGGEIPDNTLPYITVYFYKLLNLFRKTSLETAAFYLPVIFGLLSILLVFFISRKMTNNLFAFFISFLFSIHWRFFAGNYAGYNDTQILAMFFSLSIILCFIYIDFRKRLTSFILLIILLILTYFFKHSWNGWIYIIIIISTFIIIYYLLNFIKIYKSKSTKNQYYFLIFILLTLILFVTFIIMNTKYLSHIKQTFYIQEEELPTALKHISELQSLSIKEVIEFFGGVILFFIVFLEIINIFTNIIKLNINKYKLLTIVWFIPLFIISLISRRFVYYAIPPFCIIVGFFIERNYQRFLIIINHVRFKYINTKIIAPIIIILFIFIASINGINKTKEYLPYMNDAFYQTTEYIKNNSNSNATIINWWDYGYPLMYYSERSVIIDNAIYSKFLLYIVSKLLTSNNINETINIIRIILCNNQDDLGTKYLHLLYPNINESLIIRESSKSESSINFLSCKPNEAFIVLSEEDILKLNLMFKYANKNNEELKDISHFSNCLKENNKLFCTNDFIIDLENIEASANNAHPYSLVLFKDGKMYKKVYPDSKVNFSIVVYQEEGELYKSLFMDHELTDTIAVRLFGIDQFDNLKLEYVTHEPMRIVTWRVIWPKEDIQSIKNEIEIKK